MATMIKYGTKAGEDLIHDMNYRHPKGETLYEVYGKVSSKKRNSWEKIREDCNYLKGRHLHIIGASSYGYSCIYAYPIYDHRDGSIISMMIRKQTKASTYEMEMPIDEYDKRIIHKGE